MSLRVAIHQLALGGREFWAGLDEGLGRAADEGARIYLLPEYCGMQLLDPRWADGPAVEMPADSLALMTQAAKRSGDYARGIQERARRFGVTLVAGTIPDWQDGRLRNVCFIAEPDGRLHAQAKCLVTRWEAELGLAGGNQFDLLEIDGCTFAVAICYDIELPELARGAALAGAELLLVPSFTEAIWGSRRVARTAAGAAEANQMFVLTCALAGSLDLPGLEETVARSRAYAPSYPGFPDSGLLGQAPLDQDALFMVDLDLDLLRAIRHEADVSPLRDAAQAAAVQIRRIGLGQVEQPRPF